ncbi:MAG TPA: class I SAM-dependent methyltransferase [Povalibacter sp.]|nr:class I SAM-dependent methyltransferase [Povalibacter sp.]
MSDDTGRQQHWDDVYTQRAPTEVSWFEMQPLRSLQAIEATEIDKSSPIIDVGGGASTLVDELVKRGFRDLTVLDISATVLANVASRLGPAGRNVQIIRQDITQFRPTRTYGLWHDRAVFHFLTQPQDRGAYRSALLAGTVPGSHVVIATFGPQGPLRCSGLATCRYDASGLARALGEQFELVDWMVDVHSTPGGGQQQFLHTRFIRT